ncbi:MAG: DUF2892 domain-containing protein [Bdellovibrionales bacterium]|nr:DUF2892 domain-containing protein [Bdellovibrionales bacterium]
MRRNMLYWDRVLRYVLGVLLLTWSFLGGPFWSYLGFYFLASASWGFCPIYFFLQSIRES